MTALPLSTPMERAPDPPLGTAPVAKERYTSREFMRLEWQRMWTRTWLLAGRESDAPNPGDYFTFEIGIESVLVIRQADGSLAARYNVCMHRGNRLREPGRGHAESFACLFHGWRYGIDGKLLAVLDSHSFPQGCEGLDLRPVRSETWAGFVWLNLNPAAEPLRDYLGVIPEHLDPYHFEEWRAGLAPGQTRAVSADGLGLLVCNAEGRFYVIENRCPHAMVRLDAAVLRGCVLECAVHGGRLDVRDGSPRGHPIRRPAITYPVRESAGRIEITLCA